MTPSAQEQERLREEIRDRVNLVDLIGRDVALKKRGAHGHWGLCPFHSEKTPSFSVREDKAKWRCFGCGQAGDAFTWIMARRGVGFVDALQELGELTGLLDPVDGSERRPQMKPVAARKSKAELEEEDRKAIAYCRAIWSAAKPIGGTRAAAYLAGRSIITDDLPPTLRHAPAIRYSWEDGNGVVHAHGVYPAMIGAIQDVRGRVIAAHRTYLTLDGDPPAKANDLPVVDGKMLQAKKMAGRAWGGAIRLCPVARTIGLAEGIETAFSFMQQGGMPVWAAGSMWNMAACELPPGVEEVWLIPDGDSDPKATEDMLEAAADFHNRAGRRVRIVPPPPGLDWNDVAMGKAA